ncbi:oligogalacturonate lyase family protein [Paenibacillus sp. GYB004]|uniref:oligogalacturonate lyase family protein n=1 Tax=Paenibacillus sp. GYB004 TaxID=2994393 RepID=UPI002F9672E6
MSKGKRYASESSTYTDEVTGAVVRQITSFPSIHHHPFFMIPAYDDLCRRLYFISHRTGSPQLFAELQDTGELLQMTDLPNLAEWSVHPSPDGKYVYYTAGAHCCRIDTETLAEETLVDLGNVNMRERGMVASAMGTTALSRSGRWWALRYSDGGESCLLLVDTVNRTHEIILRRDSIAHLQFCPDDENLLFYAGPLSDRVWVVHRDGSGNRRLYERNAEKKEWITHETWIPGTKELAFIDWPHGVRAVNPDTLAVRTVAAFNAWHAVSNPGGDWMVADTNFPDRGIQLFRVQEGAGQPLTVCYPQATSQGAHWAGPFPYDNGPIDVYAPQHTHPHPSFRPDGKRVVFTSDRSGHAQLYEVELTSFIS